MKHVNYGILGGSLIVIVVLCWMTYLFFGFSANNVDKTSATQEISTYRTITFPSFNTYTKDGVRVQVNSAYFTYTCKNEDVSVDGVAHISEEYLNAVDSSLVDAVIKCGYAQAIFNHTLEEFIKNKRDICNEANVLVESMLKEAGLQWVQFGVEIKTDEAHLENNRIHSQYTNTTNIPNTKLQ